MRLKWQKRLQAYENLALFPGKPSSLDKIDEHLTLSSDSWKNIPVQDHSSESETHILPIKNEFGDRYLEVKNKVISLFHREVTFVFLRKKL